MSELYEAAREARLGLISTGVLKLTQGSKDVIQSIAYLFALQEADDKPAPKEMLEGIADITGELYGILREIHKKAGKDKQANTKEAE